MFHRSSPFVLALWLLIAWIGLGHAAENTLPLPRFVSLRSDTVNVRTGPGVRYPVEWVFTKRTMPVEVLEEFETWRKIRDWQGTEGWVHQTMLSGKRSVIVTGAVRDLHGDADSTSGVVARIEPGVVGQLLDCKSRMCRVDFSGQRGYLARDEFWGTYPDETVN